MSIIRIGKRARYTVIDNRVVDDSNLDYDALGLLVYLLSKPDNWDVSVMHLAKQKKSGKSKIERLLQDLQRIGYASWKRLSSGKTEWTIYEHPQPENQVKEKPQPEKPDQEKPDLENQALLNTEVEVNTEKEEPNPVPPENLNHEAWGKYMQHRTAYRFKKLKPHSIQHQMESLATLSHDMQQACVDDTCRNGWQGLFPEKPKYQQKNGGQCKSSIIDEVKSCINIGHHNWSTNGFNWTNEKAKQVFDHMASLPGGRWNFRDDRSMTIAISNAMQEIAA